MKWQNRGHEFDELGSVFQANKEIYIYGTDRDAQSIAAQLAFLGEKVRSVTPLPGRGAGREKIKTLLNWMKTKKHCVLKSVTENPSGKLVLLSVAYAGENSILEPLRKAGFALNRTLFWTEDFLRNYLPVYALYVKNLVYFPDISFIPSTKCNLNCRCCLNFTPYLKKMADEPLERLKDAIDLFFSKIDYIGMFHISGGEPLLYPHLGSLLAYIGDHYRGQVYDLAVTTNGTQDFPDELPEIFRKYQVSLICDDYTRTLPQYKKKFKKLRAVLQCNDICHRINRVRSWIDLAPEITDNSGMTEDDLVLFCNACSVPWSEYHNGKLYSCNYAHYAEKAGFAAGDATEYLDFATLTPEQKKELIEFRAGYTEKGYMEFCKHCAGFNNNPYKRIPAEQATRRG